MTTESCLLTSSLHFLNSFKEKTSSEEKRQAARVHLLWFPAHLFLLILHFGQLMCLVYNVLFFIKKDACTHCSFSGTHMKNDSRWWGITTATH